MGDSIRWWNLEDGDDAGRQLEPEVVIRELVALDIDNASAICDFVRECGWIDPNARGRRDPLEAWAQYGHEDVGQFEQVGERAQGQGAWAIDEHDGSEAFLDLGLVRFHLSIVKACALHALGVRPVPTRDFVDFMNVGLQRFTFRVIKVDDAADPLGVGHDLLFYDLLDALYLQLWNLLADDPSGFRCCPHCGTWFLRQRGRAQRGQNRVASGVTYCSKGCSAAATSKNYRDRKRREREQ